MNPLYLNEQDSLAEELLHEEELIGHLSRLAFFRINTLKLSRQKKEYTEVRIALQESIRNSLLRFVDPQSLLEHLSFGSDPLLN